MAVFGLLRAILTVYTVVLMLVLFILAFTAQCIIYIPATLLLDKQAKSLLMGRTFRYLMGVLVTLQPLWRVRVIGATTGSRRQPKSTIIMANHVSNADPFFLAHALYPWEMKYVSKSSLFHVPFGGWAMSLAGDIPVYFTPEKGGWGIKKGYVAKMMFHCRRLLREGTSIFAFPEGVRSRTGEMGDFRDGMFSLAVDTDTSIIPVAISGAQHAWPRRDWRVGPTTVYVAVGEPIKISGMDVQTLKEHVRGAIAELRETFPDYAGKKTS